MKVLHIITRDYGGAGLCCVRIHNALKKMGVESKIVTFENTLHLEDEYAYGYWQYRIGKMPSELFKKLGMKVTMRNKLIALRNETGRFYTNPCSKVNLLRCKWTKWADIIHIHQATDYLDYPSFFKEINKPVVMTLHDEYLFLGIAHYSNDVLENNALEQYYAKIKRRAFADCSRLGIVFISDFMMKQWGRNDILKGHKKCIINNSVDADAFCPVPRLEARKKLGIDADDILIGFSAMYIDHERKGLDVLSKAVDRLDSTKIRILAIGNHPSSCSWHNVIAVGSRNSAKEISEVLSAADYFAMPSLQEAFAQSPMEAMCCGLPVVVFPVSGTSELVNRDNGVVCSDFTVDALVEGIKTMMSRDYDAVNIRQDMRNRFSPELIAQKYIDFYQELSL